MQLEKSQLFLGHQQQVMVLLGACWPQEPETTQSGVSVPPVVPLPESWGSSDAAGQGVLGQGGLAGSVLSLISTWLPSLAPLSAELPGADPQPARRLCIIGDL